MKIITQNKKARYNYEILERFEAGIVLRGTEVKSVREGHCNINDAFAKFFNGELFLVNSHISEYKTGGVYNHKETAMRKLLMHRKELNKLLGKIKEKSLTLVPLKLYFTPRNLVKIEIALAKGKKLYDKRESIKKKDLNREAERHFKR